MSRALPTVRLRYLSASLVLAALLGCHGAVDYQASSLPDHWRASSTGTVIDPSTIARKSRDSNLIYPGDVLDVVIGTGIEAQAPTAWSLRVSEQGEIDIPLVGHVRVAGLALPNAEQVIRQVSIDRDVFVKPSVSLIMKERHKIKVRVAGEVNKPGGYELDADGADLLAALVAAEWLTESADTIVELRHPIKPMSAPDADQKQDASLISYSPTGTTARSVRVNLIDAAAGNAPPHHIEDGTVVSVLKRPRKEVYVAGLVRRPNSYQIPSDQPTRVLDVLAKAGDRTLSVANRVHVQRLAPDASESITIHVPYNKAKQDIHSNLVLQPGDVVTVEETPITALVETIRSFVRFGFSSAVPNGF